MLGAFVNLKLIVNNYMFIKMQPMQKSLWTRFKDSAKRGLHVWLDLMALYLLIWGVIFVVWFIIQMGFEVFGY